MRIVLTCLLAVFAFSGIACAEDPAQPVALDTPYAFATSEAAKNGAVFLSITAGEDDTLVFVSGDIAETIEIHDMNMDDGMMKMRKMEALPLSESDTVVLEPAGKHIMLLGLTKQLNEGDTFDLTLHFKKAGALPVTVSVVAPGGTPHSHDNHDMHKGHH